MLRTPTLALLTLAALTACRSSQPAQDAASQSTTSSASDRRNGAAAPETPRLTVEYPKTRKSNHTDDYFGTSVTDPYRWLEDLDSPETKAWVTAQNKVTFGYLDKIPFREQIKARLTKMWNYERYGVPQEEGANLYFSKNDGLQNQAVLYVQQKGGEGQPDVLLDPNKFSQDGTTALAGTYFSNDHRYLAYATSGGGSDWQKLKVMDLQTRKTLPDELQWVKVSGAAWAKYGFYYSRYDAPKAGQNQLSGKNEFHKVYYHKLGTPQSADKLVYEDKSMALGFRTVGTTEDERFLVLYNTDGKADGNRLAVRDLTDPKQATKFTTLMSSYEHNNSVVGNVGGQLLVLTNYKAPRYRVVLIDPKKPQEASWKEVIPQSENKLESIEHAGGHLIVTYLKDASSQVKVYSETGEFQNDIELPAIGTAAGFAGRRDAKSVYYAFTSFTYPTTIYRYDFATKQSTVLRAPKVDVNPADYVTTQVFYASKDGTKIPMFITHKKGVKLNGQNPTYLYAYGGFNVSLTPSFSVVRMLWLENGGILAIPNLRGGGEYGEAWHQAGMTPNKQNVFDDFIAAAEYLKIQNYTDTKHLALAGGSNGGLLVGAIMTQRPDLAHVALPAVGVMDMLRYQKFTIGWNWAPEYGTSDNFAQFQNLYKFSPLHNLKPGTTYPATLITTADHDDRVVPAHSFKYAAALQEANAGPNPQLIRVDVNAGHGAGKSTALQIQEWTDIWAFAFQNMGVNPYPMGR
ncbi:prolyl oligopeptidase Serine peptidase. MEROPS family S09A [Hymenobacter daecheongensis DSM 21074]|uniref:prolyl oligopeptidase n=1 Tax=Hymenobacter daecheongensis DSM 21074 TaxID=1121955 RepID=A0A1M6AEA6_9BACT|nr:prolyl oligopeptidase family serine peptidase [Hymenobacter daecheongensis]SHI34628.1 prolyl oligopeptidase Serine peptidase. MEROPS family S09A [Hymenobacter daecheongensis DSM 21074]